MLLCTTYASTINDGKRRLTLVRVRSYGKAVKEASTLMLESKHFRSSGRATARESAQGRRGVEGIWQRQTAGRVHKAWQQRAPESNNTHTETNHISEKHK